MAWPTQLPLVAILRGIRPEEAMAHARALHAAGFDTLEVPTNSPDWADSVRAIAAALPGALVGAGTVLDGQHLADTQAAGGRLAVSPHVDVALVREAVGRGMFCLPGAMTASEVFAAAQAGAHGVKIFPASTLGPGHVRALRAVLPSAFPLLAVGGVSPHNLADYLAAGCVGAGLGGELYRPGQTPETTGANAEAFVQAYNAFRGHRAPT